MEPSSPRNRAFKTSSSLYSARMIVCIRIIIFVGPAIGQIANTAQILNGLGYTLVCESDELTSFALLAMVVSD